MQQDRVTRTVQPKQQAQPKQLAQTKRPLVQPKQQLVQPKQQLVQTKQKLAETAPGLRPERDERFVRLRRGVYAEAGSAACGGRRAGYLLRIRAVHVARSHPVFARESALAAHEIPYGLEPPAVYTAGGTSTAKKKAGVVHAPVTLRPVDVVMVGDLQVCSVAYALADFARRGRAVDVVAALDFALHHGMVTHGQLLDALAQQGRRGRARAKWAIAFADPRAESVGESWSRVRVFELGFADPDLQVSVAGPTGTIWRVDMRFQRPGRRPVYGEFDGMQKYGAIAQRQDRTGVQALAAEKARDDELLFTGDPAHWVWDDVLHPARLERILVGYGIPRVRGPFAEPGSRA